MSILSIGIAVAWVYIIHAGAAAMEAEAKKQIEERKTKAKDGPIVTATELLKAYKEDVKKADEKYKGKWLRVTGKVEEEVLLALTLKSDDKDVPGAVKVLPFIAAAARGDFNKLTKGQEVTAGGKCGGKAGSDVTIDEAVLITD